LAPPKTFNKLTTTRKLPEIQCCDNGAGLRAFDAVPRFSIVARHMIARAEAWARGRGGGGKHRGEIFTTETQRTRSSETEMEMVLDSGILDFLRNSVLSVPL
jgi:hypothetical protein